MLETVQSQNIQNQSFPNQTNQIQTTINNTNQNLTETKQEDEMPNANNYKISKSQRSSFELFPQEINWPKALIDYDYSKRNLEWKFNKKPFIRNQKLIKKIENQFHPILQKYYDDKINIAMNNNEKIDLKNQLAKNYDYQLKYEQAYNIINLKDKLKGFENHPNYPKEIENEKGKKVGISKDKKCYNIISNINLSKHHFDAPEKRPKCNDNDINESKPKLINANNYKDYDIITNNYKLFNDEKKNVDLEYEKLKAVEKFYKTRNYDCIKGKYYDPEKEKQYQEDLKIKNEKLRNSKREEMFNPVNNVIYDKERLNKFDKNNQTSLLKFIHRPKIENYYRTKEYESEKKKEDSLKTKLNYDRYKLQDERGYDFINMKNIYNHYKNNSNCSNKKNAWELLKEKSGENETFTKKNIYKSPYDFTDVDKNEYEFKLKRNELLKNLPKIEDEESFKRKSIPHKIKTRNINTSPINSHPFMLKDDWFRNPKNLNMKDFNFKIMTTQNI